MRLCCEAVESECDSLSEASEDAPLLDEPDDSEELVEPEPELDPAVEDSDASAEPEPSPEAALPER